MSTVIIGLDGATWSILDSLMAADIMPFTKGLMREGTRADLLSTCMYQTVQGWTTLATGCQPGRHGVIDFVRPEHGPQGIYVKLNDARDIRCETMWSYLSEQGLRVGVLNFPLTSPPPQVNGYVVPGFVSSRHLRRNVHPAGLYDHLRTIPGFDAHHLAWDFDTEQKAVEPLPPPERDGWIRHHIVRERQWFEIMRDLTRSEPCDLTAVVFDGVDKLQHLAWPLIDIATYPEPRSVDEERWRASCLEYFRQLDHFIELIVEDAGRDATIIMASDHGFGPSHDIFHVNSWLRDAGYLQWTDEGATTTGADAMFAARARTQLFNWRHTSAYALTPSSNGIYITVGAPGSSEYERVRKELIEGLLQVRDPDTDETVIDAVMTREEAYPGPQSHVAPDLTLRLRDHGYVSVLSSDHAIQRRAEVRGMHRPDGVVFVAGPGVPGDRTAADCSLADIFPLVLHSLGVSVPDGLDGVLPKELLGDPIARQPFPRTSIPTNPALVRSTTAVDDGDLTQEEEDAIFARLRALGYLE